MTDCAVVTHPTQTVSEAERRRILAATYRIIIKALENVAKEQQQNAQQQIAQELKP